MELKAQKIAEGYIYHGFDEVKQKVRGEVTSAAITAIGNWPVKVVVFGGDAPLYTPIVLGLVE